MTTLRAVCIRCKARGPWRFTPVHRMVRYSRRITAAEIAGLAVGTESLDSWEAEHGTVSESGSTVTEHRKRLSVLVICDSCGESWWTIQRGIVSDWFVHFHMRPPLAVEDLYRAAA